MHEHEQINIYHGAMRLMCGGAMLLSLHMYITAIFHGHFHGHYRWATAMQEGMRTAGALSLTTDNTLSLGKQTKEGRWGALDGKVVVHE